MFHLSVLNSPGVARIYIKLPVFSCWNLFLCKASFKVHGQIATRVQSRTLHGMKEE